MVEASGDLVLEETLFQMDRLPKALPAPLPFTIKGAASPAENNPVDATAPKTKITKQWVTGEINLNIPGRLTVEAKNVYSVWEGQFKIAFREKGIYLLGKLTPRRGNVSFFGRNFTLSSGNVNFNDLISVPPVLDLVALYSRQDIEARLNISGIATHPSFALQSSPPLPQDEILSRILFGKDMSTITGLQALEVGMAFTSMMDKNGKTGWDMMGKAKDLLGVDQLELRESGDSAGTAEVVAGRQINNRLYLEFNQRLHEPGSTLLFEYELRRNLSISTETGTHTLPGIGVNWKRDY
jgi:translocation and assembly module TamB